jgi:hypothetical protein
MDIRSVLILVFAGCLSIFGIAYGALCVISPRKMIEMRARGSTLLNRESASDSATIWQYRFVGVAIFLGSCFFLLVVYVRATEGLGMGPH